MTASTKNRNARRANTFGGCFFLSFTDKSSFASVQSLSAPFFFRELPRKALGLHGIHCIILVSRPGVQKISISALFFRHSVLFCQRGPHLFSQAQRPGCHEIDSAHPACAESQRSQPRQKRSGKPPGQPLNVVGIFR